MKNNKIFAIFLITVICLSMIAFNIKDIEKAFAAPDEVGEEIPEEGNNTDNPQPPESSGNGSGGGQTTGSPSSNNGSGAPSSNGGGTVPVQASPAQPVDTRLSELTINCGTLVPEFSPDIYEYFVYVTKTQESKNCGTSAVAVDNSASITAEGPLEFENEDITKRITVTGANGEKAEYVINVHIITDTELLIDNKLYKITEKPDLDLLPAGFKASKKQLNGEEITVAESSDGNIFMVQYIEDSSQSDYKWYRFDAEAEKFYPSDVIEIDGEKYIVISSEGDLIYGTGPQGTGYYLYDKDTQEVGLFIGKTTEEAADQPYKIDKILLIAVPAAILICALLGIFLYKKSRKNKDKMQSADKYFRPYIFVNEDEIEIDDQENI